MADAPVELGCGSSVAGIPSIEASCMSFINHYSCFYDALWVYAVALTVQSLWAFGFGTPDLSILVQLPAVSCSGSRP